MSRILLVHGAFGGAWCCDPVLELDTDHSPWLSRTAELVAILEELARTL